jgi:hypothetical protein
MRSAAWPVHSVAWLPSRPGGNYADDRIHQRDLEDLLQEQRRELINMHLALDEANRRASPTGAATPPFGCQSPSPYLERLQAQQAAAGLREALEELERRVPPEWLYGPATSIEHELARRRHLAEVQRLEAALADPLGLGACSQPLSYSSEKCPPSTAWSRSPSRPVVLPSGGRPADVSGPFGMASPELAAWPPPARPFAEPDPTKAWPRTIEVAPSDIIVERKRRFGDHLFRLWVEDCSLRGGVRVHAMDVMSLCRSHIDLRDCDVQAMFNVYFSHNTGSMGRWIAGKAESVACEHDRDLCEFLCCLLDAAYFELDDDGSGLQLRVPAFVQPPPVVPSEDPTLIEVDNHKDPSSPLTSRWIREKILVPRSVAVERSVGQRSRSQCSGGGSARSSGLRTRSQCSGRGSVRSSPSEKPSAQKDFPVYAAGHRRQTRSAHKAAAKAHRDAVSGVPSRPSSGHRTTRASSAHRSASRGSGDGHSVCSSLLETSTQTYSNVKDAFSNPSDGGHSSPRTKQRLALGPEDGRRRRTPPRQTRPRSRPHSARGGANPVRSAAGAAGAAVRARADCGGRGPMGAASRSSSRSAMEPVTLEPGVTSSSSSRSVLASPSIVEPGPGIESELVPCPPCQPRASSARSGRPLPRGVVERYATMPPPPSHCTAASAETHSHSTNNMVLANVSVVNASDSGGTSSVTDLQQGTHAHEIVRAAHARQRLMRPTSAKTTKHKRVVDIDEKLTVYEDYEDSEPDVSDYVQVAHTRQRLVRPTSAKTAKHKRVVDADVELSVYEDCEDSEPDDADFEMEGQLSVSEGLGPESRFPPPKPLLASSTCSTAADHTEPLARSSTSSTPADNTEPAGRHSSSTPSLGGRGQHLSSAARLGGLGHSSAPGFWPAAAWCDADLMQETAAEYSWLAAAWSEREPRPSTPPPRPRPA